MSLRKPSLYDLHRSAGADFTEFGGWEMPVAFDSITREHEAVRSETGIFDVSHMGTLFIAGTDTAELLQRLTTNDVTTLSPGDIHYTCITRRDGVILDDTFLYNVPGRDDFLLVPNAGHDEAITERFVDHAEKWNLSVTVKNETEAFGMIAVQGPDAVEMVEGATRTQLDSLRRFSVTEIQIGDVDCLISRTGYTGEDGFELLYPNAAAEQIWTAFDQCTPCGLGCRDTLRLEAGYLLSGQDFHPSSNPRTPYEAKLGFVVESTDPPAVGQEALEEQREAGVDQQLIGIVVDGRGVARTGYDIVDPSTSDSVGSVTSGTMSPTFGEPLALGYVDVEYTQIGTDIGIQIRDRTIPATVVDHRFLETRSR